MQDVRFCDSGAIVMKWPEDKMAIIFGIEILWVSVSESGWLTMGTSQHQLVEDPERALREYVLQRIADRDADD
jgi:hypothetical protein